MEIMTIEFTWITMVGVEKDPRHRYATYTHENIGHYTNISKGGVESQVPVNESGKVSTYIPE